MRGEDITAVAGKIYNVSGSARAPAAYTLQLYDKAGVMIGGREVRISEIPAHGVLGFRTVVQVPGRDVRIAFFRGRHSAFVELARLLIERDGSAADEALALLEVADAALRTGDFQGFGDALDELRTLLERLSIGPTN